MEKEYSKECSIIAYFIAKYPPIKTDINKIEKIITIFLFFISSSLFFSFGNTNYFFHSNTLILL